MMLTNIRQNCYHLLYAIISIEFSIVNVFNHISQLQSLV